MKKHTLQTLCTAALISLGLSFTATGEERITDVSLIFSYDQSPEGGKEVGELTAVSSSSQFTVEGSGYLKDDDTWSYGEWPVGEVELSANEGYYFPTAARSLFHLSGDGVQYQSARTEDEGSTLILHVRLPRIDGAIPAPLTADWSGHTAVWDEAAGADQYEIQLLKDGRTLTTLTSSAASCSFENWINNEGSYTFRVRAYNRKDRKTAVGAPMQSPLSSPQRKPGSTATASGRKKMENTSFCIQTALSHRWPGGRLMENGTSLTAQDIWFPNATSVQNPPISITGSEQTACGMKTGIRNSRIGHSMRCISFLCRRNFPILPALHPACYTTQGPPPHGKA